MAERSPVPIPAATLVLFRKGAEMPELLFVERSKAMAFAGGALVFPGGRVDPGDHALATRYDGDPEDVAGRIAAIRETLEEVGVPVGLGAMTAGGIAAVRQALSRGEPLGTVLADHDLHLSIADLVSFARWCPAHVPARIFDTHFYLAEVPPHATEIYRVHAEG